MKKSSAKNKIILVLLAWLILSASMFLYFFKLLDVQNQATLDSMAQERKDLASLQAQDQSYKQAQADLQELAGKPYQPEDFFTSDISLVNEIQTLENLAAKYNLTMQISGIAGTIETLQSANTVTPIAMVPYGITLSGDFFQTVNFIESLEHLSFIANPTNISINGADNGNVSASMSANFYLKK
jgi:Tfp pilus assembly protein PilO